MSFLLLNFIKAAAPYLLLVALLFGVYSAGYLQADKKFTEREAQNKAQSNEVLYAAHLKNAAIENQLADAAQTIEKVSLENTQKIDALTDDNHKLLASRLRRQPSARSNCSALPDSSSAATGSDEAAADTWMVQRTAADRLIDRQSSADQVTETARACQDYVNKLQEAFK